MYVYMSGHILRKVYNCREQKNYRPPNILKFPVKKISHSLKTLRRPFLVISFTSYVFQPFQTLQVQLHKPTFRIIHSRNFTFSPFFSTLFHCSSSKFTTTTAQFPFYNCKLHFTTAQIVISCTLKYALLPMFDYLSKKCFLVRLLNK